MTDSETKPATPTTVSIFDAVTDDGDSSIIETGRSLPRQETKKRSKVNLFLIEEEKDNYIDQKTIQVINSLTFYLEYTILLENHSM